MMEKRSWIPGGLLVVAVALCAFAIQAQAPAGGTPPASTVCANCHDQAKTFGANPHIRAKVLSGEALCAACHGDGMAHAEAGGDKTKIVLPAGRAGSQICLTCHDRTGINRSFGNAVHAQGEAVNCLSCHSVHSPAPKAAHLLKAPPTELCSSCHTSEAASFRSKPYAHRLGRGGMECTSCHDPHSIADRSALKRATPSELPCLKCHAEKRGPFVFEHVPADTASCISCHENHGSSNPKRLIRSTVQQLCLECHSPAIGGGSTLGSQPPAFHNILTARYRNCTTCHVAIHGSNRSPQLLK